MADWLLEGSQAQTDSMKKIRLTREEKIKAAEWAADKGWVRQKRYQDDKEYLGYVRDIISSEVFNSMDQYIQHGHTTCKEHCIQVSYLSYLICKKYGWNYRSAARAGLLHDLFLYDWHTHAKETGEHFHGFTHPKVAAQNASEYFNVTEAEIQMIRRHMWPLTPIPPTSGAGMAIIYADKFCGIVEILSRMKCWLPAYSGNITVCRRRP